jgi:hypothetical protein
MILKFIHVFEGPYIITKLLDYLAYEMRDEIGKLRGEFNKDQLQMCGEADDETHIHKEVEIITTDVRTNQRLKDKENKGWITAEGLQTGKYV